MMRHLTIVVLVLVAQWCAATPFYSVKLSKIAAAVGLNLPDTIGKNASNDTLYAYKGKQLRVRTNAYGDVCHIGYKLFNNQLMDAYGESPVFDFMERYLLELDLLLDGKSLKEQMEVDNVVITKGNIGMLRAVNENTPFSIENVKRRAYRITWTVNGKPVTVGFQADCQLLKGCDAVEQEANLVRDLPKTAAMDEEEIMSAWSKAKVFVGDSIKVLDNGRYLSDLISSKLYLRIFQGKEKLLCTRKNASASINNIVLTGLFDKDISLDLVVDKYGYKTDTLRVTLQQFVSYCRAEGDKLYMGIKTVSDKELVGALFILNENLAYNHVLSFRFPMSLLQGEDDAIHAKLYAYIPLQNLTEKYFYQNLKEYKYEIK